MKRARTVRDVYNGLTEGQKHTLHYLVGRALEDGKDPTRHSKSEDLYASFTNEQKQVLHYLVDQALKELESHEKHLL